jgi:hypothetical protein
LLIAAALAFANGLEGRLLEGRGNAKQTEAQDGERDSLRGASNLRDLISDESALALAVQPASRSLVSFCEETIGQLQCWRNLLQR